MCPRPVHSLARGACARLLAHALLSAGCATVALLDVDPGQPFQVMLAHGDAQTDDQVASAISHIAKAARQHGLTEGGGAPGLLADLKLDGERLVVHKNGADISFRTRRCSDYTSTYGVTGLGEEILAMCDGLDKCVVDGEVVSLNLRTQTFANFGTNQKVAQYERALIDARKKRGAEKWRKTKVETTEHSTWISCSKQRAKCTLPPPHDGIKVEVADVRFENGISSKSVAFEKGKPHELYAACGSVMGLSLIHI